MKLFSTLLLLLVYLTSFAQEKISTLLARLNRTSPDTSKVWDYYEVSTFYQYSKPDSAIYFAGKGLELARKLKYTLGQGLSIAQLANIHEKHGNLNLSRDLTLEALGIYTNLKYRRGIASLYNTLGVIEGKKGNYNIASRYFFKALGINEKINNKLGIVQCYIKIGTVNNLTNNLDEALKYYLKAKRLNDSIPNSNATFTLLNNIGVINGKKGHFEKALEYFLNGIKLSDSPQHAGDHVALLASAGTAYRHLGQTAKALEYQRETIKKAREFDLPEEESRALVNLADLDERNRLTHLTNALKIAKSIENRKLQAEINEAIGAYYKSSGKYKEALGHFEKHRELNDSLLNIEKQAEIKSLESTYQLGKTKQQLEKLSLLHQTRTWQRNASTVAGVAAFILLLILTAYLFKTRKLNKQLLAKEKELKLLNDQLKEKTNLANKQNKAKSEFLANMSHEIRTPMNGVIGMANLLMGSNLNEEQADFVHSIKISAESLLSIINDILDFSKIESGKLELEEYPLLIHQLIEETHDLLSIKANEKNIELLYTLDPGAGQQVIGDPTRVKQILINLIGNALKFTDKGEILTNVKLLGKKGDLCELQLSVTDTGVGIPPEKLSKLFKTFSQVDSSTTRKYGGTGLGLAICTRLAALMQGRIWAESTAGRGTTFFFTIKVKACSDHATEKASLINNPLTASKTILVVDDNHLSSSIIKADCDEWGINAKTFFDAEEAFAAFQSYSFDLVVLDEVMTPMNGLELARKMQLINDRVPVILLSSDPLHAYDTMSRKLFVSILDKPLKKENLRKAILNALSGNRTLPNHIINPVNEEARRSLAPLHVLVAEDNVINQKIVSKALQNMGHSFDIVTSGRNVLSALERRSYDLILMDIQMNDMDGIEATKRIILKYGNARPYIIALTAAAFETDRQQCLDAGMDDYISKPFTMEHFYSKVHHLHTEKKLLLTRIDSQKL